MQVIASTDPKPVPGDWSGNGAPVKFSTRETREEGKGWFVIQEHLRRLQQVRGRLNRLPQAMQLQDSVGCAEESPKSTDRIEAMTMYTSTAV